MRGEHLEVDINLIGYERRGLRTNGPVRTGLSFSFVRGGTVRGAVRARQFVRGSSCEAVAEYENRHRFFALLRSVAPRFSTKGLGGLLTLVLVGVRGAGTGRKHPQGNKRVLHLCTRDATRPRGRSPQRR